MILGLICHIKNAIVFGIKMLLYVDMIHKEDTPMNKMNKAVL